jgi:hypothetical protein
MVLLMTLYIVFFNMKDVYVVNIHPSPKKKNLGNIFSLNQLTNR